VNVTGLFHVVERKMSCAVGPWSCTPT
jgi:hypothetical protein